MSETLNPVWDDVFDFPGVKSSSVLLLRVFDWDRLGSNEFMGQVSISLGELFTSSPHESVFVGIFFFFFFLIAFDSIFFSFSLLFCIFLKRLVPALLSHSR